MNARLKSELRWAMAVNLWALAVLGFTAWRADGHYDEGRLWHIGIWAAVWLVTAVHMDTIRTIAIVTKEGQ